MKVVLNKADGDCNLIMLYNADSIDAPRRWSTYLSRSHARITSLAMNTAGGADSMCEHGIPIMVYRMCP